MEQNTKNGTSFFDGKLPESGLKSDDNPKIAMKLKTGKFQNRNFVRRDVFREKGTAIALVETSEG